MKKQIIATLVAVSALSFAFAEDAATTTPPALLPVVVTGDASIDAQIRTLRIEMEMKIKALRDEYQQKLKVLVDTRKDTRKAAKADRASTTRATTTMTVKEFRREIKEERKGFIEDRRERKAATSTLLLSPRAENQKLMNLFRSFLGKVGE